MNIQDSKIQAEQNSSLRKSQEEKLQNMLEEIQTFIRSNPDRTSFLTFQEATRYYRIASQVALKNRFFPCENPWKKLREEMHDFFAQRAYNFQGYMRLVLRDSDWTNVRNAIVAAEDTIAAAKDNTRDPRLLLCVSFKKELEELNALQETLRRPENRLKKTEGE